MYMMVVRHKVQDFRIWKDAFDAHAPVRLAAGLSNARLFCSTDDANEVFIVFDVADINKAKAFAASEEVREAMANAGVVDKPDVSFLNAIE
jgi:hypothetical protein